MAEGNVKNMFVVVVRTPQILGRPMGATYISDSFKSNDEHDKAIESGELTAGRRMTRAQAEKFVSEWNTKNGFENAD